MMARPRFVTGRLGVTAVLLLLTAATLFAEAHGLPSNRLYRLGGDLRREARLIEQFGQVASAVVIGLLIWTLDPPRRRVIPAMAITLISTALLATAIKHMVGRSRPETGHAAEFRGPSTAADAERESFPSAHTAAAVAMAVVLSSLYPRGRRVFWGLAIFCGVLRYVNNAHWPSDVLGGATLGYVTASALWHVLVLRRHTDASEPASAATAATTPSPVLH
jgi:membrane-associated phospholipid phosphatase